VPLESNSCGSRDCAGDPCPTKDAHLGRPWAVIPVNDDWYIGLHSCRFGHAWMCSYAYVYTHLTDLADIWTLKISPHQIVPNDAYFREHYPISRARSRSN
jgi:hypothetical protein